MTYTFGSLFAGIGGFDLGLERAGLRCEWQVEIEPYAQKVLAKHWPDVRRHDDIKTFPPTNPEDYRVNCVVGGFPCQDISFAGKGAGLAGERSGLFYELVRVVRVLEPRVVVLENVSALLTRGLDDVLGTLASIGFDAEWHCIPAAAVGAPHIRDRIFILGYANSHSKSACAFHDEASRLQANVADSESEFDNGDHSKPTACQPKQRQFRGRSCKNALPDSNRKGLEKWQGKDTKRTRAVNWAEPIRSERWEVEPDVGRVADGVPSRVDRLRGLGNAVVPQVAEWIGHQVVRLLQQRERERGQ